MKKTFKNNVLSVIAKIPLGQTMSYRQVAERAGNPKASRAVGNIVKQNFDPKIPCHRVIRSDGKIGGYNRGGPQKKLKILRKEGFNINNSNS